MANPRDRFTLTEGISGGPSDDTLRGDDRVRAVGHELTPESMDKVTGLETLLLNAQMLNSAPDCPACSPATTSSSAAAAPTCSRVAAAPTSSTATPIST